MFGLMILLEPFFLTIFSMTVMEENGKMMYYETSLSWLPQEWEQSASWQGD